MLIASESTPGQLYCLQDGVFKRMVPDPPPDATVKGTRTAVTFVGKVLTTSASTSVACSYEGVPGGRFIVPNGMANVGGGAVGVHMQVREVAMYTDTVAHAPNDTIYFNILSTDAEGSPSSWNPWDGGPWPQLVAGADNLLADVTSDPAGDTSALVLEAGSSLTCILGVGPGYTAADDVYVTVTLWFGEYNAEGSADTLGEEGRLGRNVELTEREAELQG